MKDKLNFNNKSFKITCIVSILLLLTLGIYILVTNTKDTYAAGSTDISSSEWTWNDTMSSLDIFPQTMNNNNDISVSFTIGNVSCSLMRFSHVSSNYSYYIYYKCDDGKSLGNNKAISIIKTASTLKTTHLKDKTIILKDGSVDSDFYNWFTKNATPVNRCYYNSSNDRYYWTNELSKGEVQSAYTTQTSCEDNNEKKCYYNSSTEKFVWTNAANAGSMPSYDNFSTETDCNNASMRLTLTDNSNTLQKCLTKNSSGTCTKWDTAKKEITINLKPGYYTFDLENSSDYRGVKSGYKLKSFTLVSFNNGVTENRYSGAPSSYYFPIINKKYKNNDILNFGNINHQSTLSANWELIEEEKKEYTISYNANGGNGAPSSQIKKEGVSTYISTTEPTRDGWTFKWWNTSADGLGTIYFPNALYTTDKDLNLYAQWEENKKYYTVKYDANGGTVSRQEDKVEEGSEVQSLPTPEREGYTFLGWYTSESGGRHIGDGGVSFKPDGDITLYAHWEETPEKTYVITYSANGGNSVPSATIYKGTGKISLEYPKYFGYVFTGWNDEPTCDGNEYNRGDSIRKKDITLYACWDKVDEENRCGVRSNPETSDKELIVLAVLAISTLSWLYSYFIMKKVKQ